jgi:hypothetical protein
VTRQRRSQSLDRRTGTNARSRTNKRTTGPHPTATTQNGSHDKRR